MDLAASCSGDTNVYRNFVRWVEKQPWRKILPRPKEPPVSTRVCTSYDRTSKSRAISLIQFGKLRVQVVLVDKKKNKKAQPYLGTWHLLYPHETFSGSKCQTYDGVPTAKQLRFQSIWHYSPDLFRRVFCGEPGAPWPFMYTWSLACDSYLVSRWNLDHKNASEDLLDYWNHAKGTEWFKQHPVLPRLSETRLN